ncbi:MAG TPA: arginase family protein [Nitrososphaeraceae archaeon]|nr:arginase family protein [Nitrososphaeraceae archaeon]
MNALERLDQFFINPEKTNAKCSFGDYPTKITFQDSNAILYGIPLDITTSFGKGTSYGPEAIRITSAKQIESFVLDENREIYEKIRIYDIGDLILVDSKINNKYNKVSENNFNTIALKIDKINSTIRSEKKIPIILGGEHTLSYFSIKSISKENPIIIHFDAHRDMKPIYDRKKICHTTPFFHLINEGHVKGNNIIQIGIRQTDKEENDIAIKNDVNTFTGWHINKNIDQVKKEIKKLTNNRNIYISFDIDVYDICYVPCTGTPEPFGLDPFQIIEILKSINNTSKLIGIDIVEVAVKNNDYREGTLATQTLYRIFSHTKY